MKVSELIKQLEQMPQDYLVVIPGYEGGYDTPDAEPEIMTLWLTPWSGIWGVYDDHHWRDEYQGPPQPTVVLDAGAHRLQALEGLGTL